MRSRRETSLRARHTFLAQTVVVAASSKKRRGSTDRSLEPPLFGQSVVLALDDASTLTLPQRSVAMESFAARSWCFRCNELLLFRTVATTPGCAW
jgi:hypothetical protein